MFKLRIWYILILIVVLISLTSGCKPEGGGGISGTISPTADGGPHPGFQTLIIDENSISVESITESSVAICWETNFPSTSTVEYGEVNNYAQTSKLDSDYKLKHRVELTGLKYNQGYHFKCISTDIYKNNVESHDHTFKTKEYNNPPVAVVLENPTDVTYNSVKLTWSVSNDLDFKEYDIRYDTTSSVTINSPLATKISEKLLNSCEVDKLSSESKYYFRVFVMDTIENQTGSNIVFATTGIDYKPPEPVQFLEPENRGIRSITLRWQEYSGSYFSKYKIYKSTVPGFKLGLTEEVAITNQQSTSWEDSNLNPATTYYYKIVVENQGGYLALSDEKSFSTRNFGEVMGTVKNVYSPVDIKRVKSEYFISTYGSIMVYSPTEDRIITSMESRGNNSSLELSKDEESIFVVSSTYNEIREFNTSTRYMVNSTKLGDSLKSITLSNDESQLYVTSFYDHYLYVLKRKDFELETRISTGRWPSDAKIGINLDKIIVADSGTTSVAIYDSHTLKLTNEVQIGSNPYKLFRDPGGKIIYILDYTGGNLIRFDLQSESVVDNLNVGSEPSDLVIINNGRGMLLTLSGDNMVKKYELPSMREVYSFNTGNEPVAIEVSNDEKTAYILNYGDDTMTKHIIE